MKYNFDKFKPGEKREIFKDKTEGGLSGERTSVLNCAKNYCKVRGLSWEFRTLTIGGKLYLVRVL